MELDRHCITDAYTLEELRRAYLRADGKGRIRLLEKLSQVHPYGPNIPYEIALMAVTDDLVEVREWMALKGKWFDYRERQYTKDLEGPETYTYPDRDLVERLKQDPDPYVRACLRENPAVYDSLPLRREVWMEWFLESNHLERLALVRNPRVSDELIETLFDRDDVSLQIDWPQRAELITAYLTNASSLESSREDYWTYVDGSGAYDARKHSSRLWELASKWPKESKLEALVYRMVDAPDEKKAEIYRNCEIGVWRRMILENCDAKDKQTLALGMADQDDSCRAQAYQTVEWLSKDQFEKLLLSKDEMGMLWGAARNRNLPIWMLEKIRERLGELGSSWGDNWGFKDACDSIRAKRNTEIPEKPDDLFSDDETKGRFLEEKVNYIGRTLWGWQQAFQKSIAWLPRLIVIGAVVYLIVQFLGSVFH